MPSVFGLETPGGMRDACATARGSGLPAPPDVDDLLQNRLGPQFRAVRDAVLRDPPARC